MTSTVEPFELLGQLLGYGLALTLSVILVMLVWQSPGRGRGARSLFSACAALWSFGGLMRSVLLAVASRPSPMALAAMNCLSFSAAAVWPVGLSMLWNTKSDLTAVELVVARWLVRLACVTATLLVLGLIGLLLSPRDTIARQLLQLSMSEDQIRMSVGYNALVLILSGYVLMRRHFRSGPERVGIALMLLGPAGSIAVHFVSHSGLLPSAWDALAVVLRKQSVTLTILGGLFSLGRFRASDRFARISLRIVLAWGLGITLAWLANGPIPDLARLSTVPGVVSFTSLALAATVGILSFVLLGRASDRWIERQIFGELDPSVALRSLREDLAREDEWGEVVAVAERFLSKAIQMDARILSSATNSGDPSDWIPVRVGDTEPYKLALPVGSGRKALVSSELELLNGVGEMVGRRLEALDRERERIERSRREAHLMHQLVEAELRALRAQINPHFLFNALNTIAALVHQEPSIAEGMTVRLAKIFRHLLTQTERPFSTVAQEMDFLHAYLDIEKVRFGERLRIEFHIPDTISARLVPSLILQPLVENAIKHGLAPKLGACQLLICGCMEGDQMILRVEDNGVGTSFDTEDSSSGIGMRNIRERLNTLYGGQARLSFESRPRSGSCATVYLPIGAQ